MKICVVTTAFPHREEYGEGMFIWEAVRAVARHGHQVQVVAMHHPDALNYEVIDGIEIRRPTYWWPVSKEMLRKDVGGLPVNWRRYPLARLQMLPFMLVHGLAALHCARDCDVVHAHWALSAAVAYTGKVFHRRPVVATLQGSDIFQAVKLPFVTSLIRYILRRCDQVTVLSQALKQATVKIGVPADDVCIIPNGVDINNFVPLNPNCRENVILYVGSLIHRKGVNYLIDAFCNILSQLPDYRLVIIGDGPAAEDLKDQVQHLGIADFVDFHGFMSQEDVKFWMQRARLFVLPSVEEGLGVVLLEALACGTPIVASRVGGIVDVVTDDVGCLVPPADVQAFSQAIVQVLRANQWEAMSMRARERAVAHYDWDVIAGKYIAIYSRVASRS